MANAYVTNRASKLIFGTYFTNAAADEPASFKLALCTKKNEQGIDNAAAVDKTGGLVGIPVTAHGLAAGDTIAIDDTINYDGWYLIVSQTTNEIVITATYVAESFAGTEKLHEAPGPNTNVLTDLQEIAAGNGYSAGGKAVERNATVGFDTLTEDDTNNQAYIQLRNVEWTGSGGSIPASGGGIRYPVLVDDAANVLLWWDIGTYDSVSSGQKFAIQDAEISMIATE
jgi:hypothetical protein